MSSSPSSPLYPSVRSFETAGVEGNAFEGSAFDGNALESAEYDLPPLPPLPTLRIRPLSPFVAPWTVNGTTAPADSVVEAASAALAPASSAPSQAAVPGPRFAPPATPDSEPVDAEVVPAEINGADVTEAEVVEAEIAAPPNGRSVLVLGGTGAVGSAIAAGLAQAGDRIAIHHGTRAELAVSIVESLPGDGHQAFGADLTDPSATVDLIATVDAEFSGIDVLVFAAASRSADPIDPVGDTEQWSEHLAQVLSLEVLGAAAAAHAAAAVFRARGRGGRIIFVPAQGHPTDGPDDAVRETASAAVAALGRSLAHLLAPFGIGVTTVTAGAAAGSGWSPEQLAETVTWLVNGPVTALPGAVIRVEG